MDIVFPVLVFLVLLASAWAGWFARTKLQERHTSHETFDSIRLLMGMLLTFSALVLGLLTSNAKNRFDNYDKELALLSANFIDLDHRLRLYGAEGDPIRKDLRTYLAAAIADSWPSQPHPAGDYPTFPQRSGFERQTLGDLLSRADQQILQLKPADDFHREAATRMRDISSDIIQTRWQIITSTGSDISWPFLFILASWLAIIFGVFGLTSPRNGLVYVAVVMSALSITSPLFLIMDYSDAMNGLLQLSSAPMRTALIHLDAP
ncbi:hypothetical protein DLM45_14320 [Hyphomicrobium methylovorum]|uniref:bestrophin-like domain n=1 Tax=Hyphomicrobium methylovorum TaxID=84 RepID=UPI0015E728AF|nr:hypothetical protein [Hyphomicrobium methylovorum]MBA2127388.1 hypothetical protein [Hyphomicrobium methylovorum]